MIDRDGAAQVTVRVVSPLDRIEDAVRAARFAMRILDAAEIDTAVVDRVIPDDVVGDKVDA